LLWIHNDLNDATGISQVNEYHAAMIATAVYPSADLNFTANIGLEN
jgi:hypothetical protein